ncbi:MAG: hypothetical protein LPK85_05030, partial [Gammaproteobacteria bacterium]|nr:hypothetical protein [Gammaproteobacteria bacterium]
MKSSHKLLCAAITAALAAQAQAYVVDGINTGGTEYLHTQDWGFYDGHGASLGDIKGSISWGMDASYIYILLAAPTNFVDNVYGAPADDVGSGWVTEPAASGGAGGGKKKSKDAKKSKSGHTFKDLLGSDKVWFDVDVDGDGSADSYIELDYIELLSGQYAAKVLKDTDGLIQSVATSLQYNLSQGNTCAVRSGSTPVDSISGGTCVDQLMYEFSFLASDFTDFTLASLSN